MKINSQKMSQPRWLPYLKQNFIALILAH